MIRRSMLVIAAVGGLGVGVVAAGPAADAAKTHAAPHVTITSASPAEVNTPTLVIKHRDPNAHLASGDIFAGPKFDLGTPPAGSAIGPDIVDDHGRQIYFKNSKAGDRATDVREQMYNGQPVLTYWLGHSDVNPGVGAGQRPHPQLEVPDHPHRARPRQRPGSRAAPSGRPARVPADARAAPRSSSRTA